MHSFSEIMGGPLTSSTSRNEIDWQGLDSLVPANTLSAGDASIAVDALSPTRVVTPENEEQLSKILEWANRSGVCIAASGGGTKLGWGNRPASVDLVISTKKMSRIVDHRWDDMTVTVQAGATIGDLQRRLGLHRQRLALDPLWPEKATVGGVISTNDSGALRLRYGSVRDLILGATVVLADGVVAKSGGKVVKNVAGYDLPKLITGALGTLAIITEATFRVHPQPHQTRTLTYLFADTASANRFIFAVNDSMLVPAAVQMRCGSGSNCQVDILLEGLLAGIDAQCEGLARIADGAQCTTSEVGVWDGRERLYDGDRYSATLKFSILPDSIGRVSEVVCSISPNATVIAQATGLGTARIDATTTEGLAVETQKICEAVREIGGSAVVHVCPAEIKSRFDVWGATGNSQELMVRVKQQFDPNGILNRGRFVGGI